VLYLDTLKVSTIEQTAETADARGGKGNPKLITWDYGKEINVTIEDALFSSKSMAIMFGNGKVETANENVQRTVMVRVVADTTGNVTTNFFTADTYDSKQGSVRQKVYMLSTGEFSDGALYKDSGLTIDYLTTEQGEKITISADTIVSNWAATLKPYVGQKVFVTYSVSAAQKTIVISGDSFPGTYYVVGDTYARSDVDGSDQFFQFIIPKAKVTSENTITLEAEGDPSVFSMNLTVLRPESGDMMKLVQYDLTAG
jgi:spore coat protein U-like protein